MKLHLYVLDGRTPVLCDDLFQWATRMVNDDIRIARYVDEGVWVSTVFLGRAFHFVRGKPALFETMVFYGDTWSVQHRYCTWEEAEAGHARAVDAVLAVRDLVHEDAIKALHRLLRLPKAKRGGD